MARVQGMCGRPRRAGLAFCLAPKPAEDFHGEPWLFADRARRQSGSGGRAPAHLRSRLTKGVHCRPRPEGQEGCSPVHQRQDVEHGGHVRVVVA